MKRIYPAFLLWLTSMGTMAQGAPAFTFENESALSQWTVMGGELSISGEHYKDGEKSLCWEASNGDVMTASFNALQTSGAAFFYVYNCKVSEDVLVIDFMRNDDVKRTAKVALNFRGWRDFDRLYSEYTNGGVTTINKVRFSLQTSDSDKKKIFFDSMNFNATANSSREHGYHMILDREQLTGGTSRLDIYANPIDIAGEPTEEEITDFEAIRDNLKEKLDFNPSGNITSINAARQYAKGFNIVRNEDGTVRGDVIDTRANSEMMSVDNLKTLSKHVSALAAAATKATAKDSDKELFENFIDHLLDQGIAEGIKYKIAPNTYTPIKEVPKGFLQAMDAYTPEQRVEMLKMIKWLSEFGMAFYPEGSYLNRFDSDVIYTYLPTFFGYVISQPTVKEGVTQLKAMKRFLERNTEYSLGGRDILKPDGTGFHHSTHYNNYMYSYKVWVEYINYLKGTSFRISQPAYERLKKAIVSEYIMATRTSGDTRHIANSLCGRNPFGQGGVSVQFTKNLFADMISVGGDIMGKEMDEDLAAAYNYFFMSDRYAVPEQKYEGFYPFSYGRLGIYRMDNWVATMRAPTAFSFGAEIYSGQNRFGRYQSNGTLEITYDGGGLNVSGYPTNNGAGWDWNVIPGATTVHTVAWRDLMPASNTTGRHDAFGLAGSYAGALASKDRECGIFVSDYGQVAYGDFKYNTNLKFKKSVFAIDGMLISLGSDISALGTYNSEMNTATNLFQNIISSVSGHLVVNGADISDTYKETDNLDNNLWMITPHNTGYYVPKGNDAVEIIYGEQKTPNQNGSDADNPQTAAVAAKAFINHGFAPSNGSYEFVVIPNTTKDKMQDLAAKFGDDGGEIYKIECHTGQLHAVTYKPKAVTAYTFFDTADDIAFGHIKASETEQLVLLKESGTGMNTRLDISVSNANMRDESNSTWAFLPQPTQTSITVRGNWKLADNMEGVSIKNENDETIISYELSEGNPIYFTLIDINATGLSGNAQLAQWVYLSQDSTHKNARLFFREATKQGTVLSVYSSSGTLFYRTVLPEGMTSYSLDNCPVGNGVNYVQVVQAADSKVFKWIR